MDYLTTQNIYRSPERRVSHLVGRAADWFFYPKIAAIVLRASRSSKRGKYGGEKWVRSSLDVLHALESVGIKFEIENFSAFQNMDSPCVFVGNHMSTLETFVLPCLIRPYREVTFIVKKELIEYPVFKHVMIHCDPIVVGRMNPREDLKAVMAGGEERLSRNVSIVVFPQTTRMVDFDPKQFNTIAVKLAKRSGVPLVPFALRTDAWGNGKKIKEFGTIDPSKPVHICFGEPLRVSGSGKEEHEFIIQFIMDKLQLWFS